ncbi:MAG: hypothetical protein QF872_09370, partial [Gammaproteobacteria bacterium]|nr:hypothetical protein [Gammaproteobacteria bacterium]
GVEKGIVSLLVHDIIKVKQCDAEPNLTGMINMIFYFRIVCVLIASVMATHALSQDLSSWSDKTVCRLAASQQGSPQYLQEAKNRGLSCAADVVKQQGSVIANNSYTMFSEDFENGDRRDVQVDDNGNNKWHIKQDEDGNSIFCNKVTNLWADYNLGSENGANYSISYRMKFAADKEGQLETHIRKTNDGAYRASIYSLPGRANIEFARSADRFYESIASGVASTKVDAWSEIQLIASGNDINYLVDGKIVASATDSRAKNGFAMIAVAPNSAVCIDDIVVSKIKVKSDEITFFDQEYEIPDNIASQPNDATISHYYMKNDTLRLRPEAYKVDASSNPVKFVKQIEQHKVIDREMATKTAFSYLYYED